MITVIAPHARPEFSANLLANFRRQRGVDARLLVVENGAAWGTTQTGEGVEVTWSGSHQADAMNTGLAWLIANGGGPWARFDDDDWYSPDYLSETLALLGRAEVVGKPWGFVMLDDGLYRFSGGKHFTGGTLAARSPAVLQFERRPDDDLDWCKRMRANGAEMLAGEPWGYCYDRRTRAAPRVIPGGPAVTRFAFGVADYYGPLPIEAVDDKSISPRRIAWKPTDEELVTEMTR